MQTIDREEMLFSRAEPPVFVVSDEIAELTRKNESGILHRIRMMKGVNVAKRLNTSEATVSRMSDWEVTRMSQILAAMGLKAVPIELRCLPAAQMEMITKNSEMFQAMVKALNQNPTIEQLSFED